MKSNVLIGYPWGSLIIDLLNAAEDRREGWRRKTGKY